MKKSILIISALFISAGLFSQTIGAKAGVGFNTVSLSEGDDFPDGAELGDNASGVGFHVGAYASFGLSDNISFRPELLFDIRKTSSDESTTTEIFGTTVKTESESDDSFSYLSVPLLVEYKLNDNLGVHLGPVVSFLAGYKSSFEATTTTTTGGDTTTETTSGESTDTDGLNGMNLDLGVGAIYAMESGLNFGLRYNLGLNSIIEETDFVKSKWGVVAISVGYDISKP